MWRLFDLPDFVRGKRLTLALAIFMLAWSYFDPHGFIGTAGEWGRHTFAPFTHWLNDLAAKPPVSHR